MVFPLKGKRVWVAGHRGMVGSAIVRRLSVEDCEVLIADRKAVHLKRQDQTHAWIAANKPDAIFLAAAKVGGVFANDTRPAEFLYDNLMIESNIIEGARQAEVQKLLFLVLLMQRYSDFEHVNVGSGEDITILNLAKLVCEVIGFHTDIVTGENLRGRSNSEDVSVEAHPFIQ